MGTRVGRKIRQSWRDEVLSQGVSGMAIGFGLMALSAAIFVACIIGGVR